MTEPTDDFDLVAPFDPAIWEGIHETRAACKAADAQIAALREAFTAYGQHQQPCEYGPAVRCTCGYIDTLRGLTR